MSSPPLSELPVPRRSYEFGPFRLDEVEHHLLRGVEEIPLTPKAAEVLLLLVRSGGRTVTKEEFMREVWRDTFVEEANLTDNVWTLRQILGDDPRRPTYIKTVPKVGYRFLPPIRITEASLIIHERSRAHLLIEEETPDAPPVVTARVSRLALTIAATLGVAALVMIPMARNRFVSRSNAPTARQSEPAPVLSRITTYAEDEFCPALSPDGRFLAYVSWSARSPESIPLHVRQVDVGTPMKLTSVNGRDGSPAWSPDGRYIAFGRLTQEPAQNGVYLIPALGGKERQLVVAEVGDLSWSPNGRTLAFGAKESANAPYAISLVDVETGKTRPLTHPPTDSFGDNYVAFSPDGKQVAYARLGPAGGGDLFVVSESGGEPRRVTFDDRRIVGLAWDPRRDQLIFSSSRNDRKILWKVPSTGGTPVPLDPTVEDAFDPAVSQNGESLVYTRISHDASIYRLDLTNEPPAPSPLLATSAYEGYPRLSPDGKRMAFESDRSGQSEIWVANADGSDPGPLTSTGSEGASHASWSPNGAEIAFTTRHRGISEIHAIGATGGRARRLTSLSNAAAPSWSRDGRWVYFSTNRDGMWQIWRVASSGGPATQITRNGGYESTESTDGRSLFYTKFGSTSTGLFRQPLPSGEEEMLYPLPQLFSMGDWALTERGFYFIHRFDRRDDQKLRPAKKQAIRFFDFATRTITDITPLSDPGGDPGLSIIENGRAIVYSKSSAQHDVMMIRHYR